MYSSGTLFTVQHYFLSTFWVASSKKLRTCQNNQMLQYGQFASTLPYVVGPVHSCLTTRHYVETADFYLWQRLSLRQGRYIRCHCRPGSGWQHIWTRRRFGQSARLQFPSVAVDPGTERSGTAWTPELSPLDHRWSDRPRILPCVSVLQTKLKLRKSVHVILQQKFNFSFPKAEYLTASIFLNRAFQ